MKKVEKLSPFKKLCATIGNLPSSYVDSLSYYELLMWLCKYIQTSVTPTLNNCVEAITELQHYFENLDVQEEIDNKLDEMAESGKLQEIISEYLNSTAIFEFDTVSDMLSGENLINGSNARTYGKNTYNDGLGAFYKIREITNDDVVDNVNIIAMNTSDTLIAEKILDYDVLDKPTNRKYIFIGDSYGTGQNELGEQTVPWTTLVPQYLGLREDQYYKDSSNGSGFLNGYLFLNQLKRVEENVVNKNSITDIVIIGGYNDGGYQVDAILEAMETFFTYAKSHFPNATVSLGCVGWSRIYEARQHVANRSLRAYTQCGKFGGRYLNNVEYILHDYSLFSNDNYHPNQNGQNELSSYLAEAITNGSCNVVRGFVTPTTGLYDDTSTIEPSYILQMQNNGVITLAINIGYFTIGTGVTLQRGSNLSLLKFTDGLIMGTGIPAFNTRVTVFGADSTATNLYDIPAVISPVYDSTNVCCNLVLQVDMTKNTYSNVSAFRIGVVYIELPALYV